MTIGATIMENLDTLNKTVQNEGEKAIVEMKIQRVTELGNKEKQVTMIMKKWLTYVSLRLPKLVR